MRKLKRKIKRFLSEWLIRKRRQEVALELQRDLKLAKTPVFRQAGSRGYDSVYLVSGEAGTIGMMRLLNPYKRSGDTQMKDIHKPGVGRIDYEWAIYQKGGAQSLTPKALWRSHDALLCEYLPHRRLQADVEKNPEQAWEAILLAAKNLHRLHAAGIAHMDASLANMLVDGQGQARFIDFEYAPADTLPFAAQKVFDHLRLVESVWKFIPDGKKDDFSQWLDYFTSCLDDEMRKTDLSRLEHTLTHLLGSAGLGVKIRGMFVQNA